MKVKRFLNPAALALATLFAASAQAQDLRRDPQGDILTTQDGTEIRLPVCHDSEGAKVRFQLRTRGNPMDPLVWEALSTFAPMSGPLIQFGPGMLTQKPSVINFIAEHECAHHQRGHIRALYMAHVRGTKTQDPHPLELQADCDAVARVRDKHGYGPEELAEVFAAFPPHEQSQTHPPTAERLRRAIACLAP